MFIEPLGGGINPSASGVPGVSTGVSTFKESIPAGGGTGGGGTGVGGTGIGGTGVGGTGIGGTGIGGTGIGGTGLGGTGLGGTGLGGATREFSFASSCLSKKSSQDSPYSFVSLAMRTVSFFPYSA